MRRTVLGVNGTWLAAAAVLLVFAPRTWARGGRGNWFAAAETPLDRPSPEAAAQWRFLSDALAVLPAGATYTILAPTRDAEMNLLMMSLGLYVPRGHLPIPSSYFGVGWSGRGQGAEWALEYGCRETAPDPHEASGRVLVRVRGGCVLRSDPKPGP